MMWWSAIKRFLANMWFGDRVSEPADRWHHLRPKRFISRAMPCCGAESTADRTQIPPSGIPGYCAVCGAIIFSGRAGEMRLATEDEEREFLANGSQFAREARFNRELVERTKRAKRPAGEDSCGPFKLSAP